VTEALKQFLVLKVVPVAAAALTTWLIGSAQVLNLFGLTEGTLRGIIAQALTFGVTYVGSLFAAHKITLGVYSPQARAVRLGQGKSR
jgi:hypothetical protein